MPANLDRLLAVMARLRDPEGGCPWDLEQNFATIAPYTIEEAYEVADAIERGDLHGLCDELGDLLLQVVFHARMAEEQQAFAFDDVAAAIADKMERRHPHVFGDADSAGLRTSWETQKVHERARKAAEAGRKASVLDDVPRALPALVRAGKLQKRAAREGFDWASLAPVLAKVDEELGELRAEIAGDAPRRRLEDELGDVLFACVNLARHLGIDAETALRGTNAKFESRFRAIERALADRGLEPGDVDLDELESLWLAAKHAENGGGT
jgi:ATP diphosphatase